MLSNKTQEALKVFLEGVKNDTGVQVTDMSLYQHKEQESSQKQIERMKDLGFKEKGNNGTHWMGIDRKLKVDEVGIDLTRFYEPEEKEEPLTYCTATDCLGGPDPDSEDGLCAYHMEKHAEEWEAEQKHQDYEYKQSKI